MSTPSESLRRMALAEDDGARLDVAVGRRFPSISRRVARRLALEGKIHLDGIASPPSTRVRAGQVLAICVRTGPREVPGASILQVSERFVYAFKPAGVHTHRLRPDEDASLADFVTDAHPECADASDASREGGALHRLDFATSGVVAFARSADAWAEGRALFSRGLVSKHYLAVSTWGNAPTRRWPPELPEGAFDAWLRPWSNAGGDGQIPPLPSLHRPLALTTPETPPLHVRAPLGAGPDRRKMEVRLDGQRASTIVRRLGEAAEAILLHVQIETGLRHQIRAHLAWLGVPIRGDEMYGPRAGGRLHLHSWMLHFADAQSPEPPVTAPAPPDLIPDVFFDPSEPPTAP